MGRVNRAVDLQVWMTSWSVASLRPSVRPPARVCQSAHVSPWRTATDSIDIPVCYLCCLRSLVAHLVISVMLHTTVVRRPLVLSPGMSDELRDAGHLDSVGRRRRFGPAALPIPAVRRPTDRPTDLSTDRAPPMCRPTANRLQGLPK